MRASTEVILVGLTVGAGCVVGGGDLVHLPGMHERPSPEVVGEAFDDAHEAGNAYYGLLLAPEEISVNEAVDQAFAAGQNPRVGDFIDALEQTAHTETLTTGDVEARSRSVHDSFYAYADAQARYNNIQRRSVDWVLRERAFNSMVAMAYSCSAGVLVCAAIELVIKFRARDAISSN